jgi:hypothetical protein
MATERMLRSRKLPSQWRETESALLASSSDQNGAAFGRPDLFLESFFLLLLERRFITTLCAVLMLS